MKQCQLCGKTHDLTKHHIVPKTILRQARFTAKIRFSNTCQLCWDCHNLFHKKHKISARKDWLDPALWLKDFNGFLTENKPALSNARPA